MEEKAAETDTSVGVDVVVTVSVDMWIWILGIGLLGFTLYPLSPRCPLMLCMSLFVPSAAVLAFVAPEYLFSWSAEERLVDVGCGLVRSRWAGCKIVTSY